jgi:hypothetical protein
MMTKKDYELIADTFRLAESVTATSGLYDAELALGLAATMLADRLERQNPRFNRELFIKACEPSE